MQIDFAMGYKTYNDMTSNILTKDILLQHTTSENIYMKFLGLTDFPKGNISSPFSEDKKPSFNLYHKGSTLKFKCGSTGKQGDLFNFIGFLKEIDDSTKEGFIEVLQIIATEMNVPLQQDFKTFAKENQTFAKPLQKPEKTVAT